MDSFIRREVRIPLGEFAGIKAVELTPPQYAKIENLVPTAISTSKQLRGLPVSFELNGIMVTVDPTSDETLVIDDWRHRHAMARNQSGQSTAI